MIEHKIQARNSVDLLLRTTQQIHLELSVMADQKANIIIAFCSVLFSVSLTQIGGLDLTWGFFVLILCSAAAMIAAILTLIPRIGGNKAPLMAKALNPLFFGHFTSLSQDEYMSRMKDLINNDEEMYETLIKDIYQSGLVLKNKKYKYLRISYSFFFGGLILSPVVFAIEYFL